MRTRTELGQLHLSEAIRRQRDCLQVIGKTAGRLAPRARFELATLRLTAECSTIELPGNSVVMRHLHSATEQAS